MIEALRDLIGGQLAELRAFLEADFDPVRDTVDIALVALAIYWGLLLIRGTRAVQVLIGLGFLMLARVAAEFAELSTVTFVLDNFLAPAVLIVVILFQNDIRRALARVGRGFSPRFSERDESRVLEEVVRACAELARRRVGALIVFERDTRLEDLTEGGSALDAAVSKDLLVSLFLRPRRCSTARRDRPRPRAERELHPAAHAAQRAARGRRHAPPRGLGNHRGERRDRCRGIGGDLGDLDRAGGRAHDAARSSTPARRAAGLLRAGAGRTR
jgi:hypothetical protein